MTLASAPPRVPAPPDTAPHAPSHPAAPWEAGAPRPAARARRRWGNVAPGAAAWLAALVILAASYGAAWWRIRPQLAKPYVYDEAAFAFAGQAVAQTGIPLSNVGHMQTETPGDFSKRFNWALWHPPLYVFTLGWAFRQFGESEQTARLVGVVCNALTGLAVFAAAWRLLAARSRGAPAYAALGAALYVTNPIVIQSALLLDIDGTVLVASAALLALVQVQLLASGRRLGDPRTLLLVGAAALCVGVSLWAKLSTSLLVLLAAALVRLLPARPWRPWRVVTDVAMPGLLGGGLFLVTWWAACRATGMPFWLPFRIFALEIADASHGAGGWRENPRVLLDLVAYVALWVSPYLLLLFAWAAASGAAGVVRDSAGLAAAALRRRGWSPRETWEAPAAAFVLMAGAGIGVAYLVKMAASFPKYHISMMPFWAVGVAWLLGRHVGRVRWWEVPALGAALLASAAYFVARVGDRHVLFRGWEFLADLVAWPAALCVGFLAASAALGLRDLPRQLAVAGVLLTAGFSWGVGEAQRRADYSTAYNYGTAGQKAAAAYLDGILRPDQPYVGSRDIAYYAANQLYVDQDTWWEHVARLDQRGITVFDGDIAGYRRIEVLALFLWDPTLGAIAHAYLDPMYDVTFQSGAYVVFTRWAP